MDSSFLPAFGMTLLAGLSTGIGSLIALLWRHTNRKFLSVALGFSAGVMIYVSLVEILDKARTALAIAIHNFPEGLATFVSALQEPGLAVPIVAAIAIHNIPEGIAVSVPIYQATGSRGRAFGYSFLSGLAEPVGALVGWLLLRPVMNDTVFGVLFAGVAGIMVFISFDELLPAAREYGENHLSLYGLIAGMAVMAVSLLLFL